MNLKISDIYKMIDEIAPFKLAESFDNVGLIIDSGDKFVNKVLFALDLTSAVADEAIEIGADLIITHHPVLFESVKRLSVGDPTQKALIKLLKNGISHIAAHTSWDSAKNGSNWIICEKLGLQNHRSLLPKSVKKYKISVFVPRDYSEKVLEAMISKGAGQSKNYSGCSFMTAGEGRFVPMMGANPSIGRVGNFEKVEEIRIETEVDENNLQKVIAEMLSVHPYEEVAYDVFEQEKCNSDDNLGLIRIGELKKQVKLSEFINSVKRNMQLDFVRKSTGEDILIKKVAVASGSGSSLFDVAANSGADVFLTSEIKHNIALEAQEIGIVLVEIGHYESEKPGVKHLMDSLQQMINPIECNIELFLSVKEQNPMVLVYS